VIDREFENNVQMVAWLKANGYSVEGNLSGPICNSGGNWVGTFTRCKVVRYVIHIDEKPPPLGIQVSDSLATKETVG